eukprot:8445237-Pyramimonas_sp.AAC.1
MEPEAGSPMETLTTDDAMKKVMEAIGKGTATLFTAQSRKKAAPKDNEAAATATGAAASAGPGLTGKPLWDTITQSVLHHSTVHNREEHIVCSFGQSRVQCPDFFNACEEHQQAVIVGLREGPDTLPPEDTILGSEQVVDYELML